MRQERTVYLHRWIRSELLLTFAALFLSATPTAAQQTRSNPESLIVPGEIGRTGGRIVVSLRMRHRAK